MTTFPILLSVYLSPFVRFVRSVGLSVCPSVRLNEWVDLVFVLGRREKNEITSLKKATLSESFVVVRWFCGGNAVMNDGFLLKGNAPSEILKLNFWGVRPDEHFTRPEA